MFNIQMECNEVEIKKEWLTFDGFCNFLKELKYWAQTDEDGEISYIYIYIYIFSMGKLILVWKMKVILKQLICSLIM